MTNEVAERYAQGLFELARETGTVREKKEQAGLILRAIDENPELFDYPSVGTRSIRRNDIHFGMSTLHGRF